VTTVVKLYSDQPPKGRALLVAKAIAEATNLGGTDCILLAEALFWHHHPPSAPLPLTVTRPENAAALVAICASCGITVQQWSREEL
jgi:hypothetical protein